MYANVGVGMANEKKRKKDLKKKRAASETVWEVAFGDDGDGDDVSREGDSVTYGEDCVSTTPFRGRSPSPTPEYESGIVEKVKRESLASITGQGGGQRIYLKKVHMTQSHSKRNRRKSEDGFEEIAPRPSVFKRMLASTLSQDELLVTPIQQLKARMRRSSFVFMSRRDKLWLLVDDPSSSQTAMIIAILIMFLIVLSCTTFVLETMPTLDPDSNPSAKYAFMVVEYWACGVFTLEYITRLFSCPNPLTFIFEPFNIVDLVAILPFYLQLMVSDVSSGLVVLRVIRLMRVVRVLKLSKYSTGMQIFITALKNSGQALGMLTFFSMIGCVLFSSIIYFVENGANPQMYPSIPASFWWCIVTMTTVGYGDVYPITELGQLVAALTMYSGLLMLTLPMSVIGGNFSAAMEESEAKKRTMEEELASDEEEEEDLNDVAEIIQQISQPGTNLPSYIQESPRRMHRDSIESHGSFLAPDNIKKRSYVKEEKAVLHDLDTANRLTPDKTQAAGSSYASSSSKKDLILSELTLLQKKVGGMGDDLRSLKGAITRLTAIVETIPFDTQKEGDQLPPAPLKSMPQSAQEKLPETDTILA